MSSDFYMRRCFQLAMQGAGRVAPNPLVGCVIVHEGKIIGEGYHTAYGKAHAEIEAINSVEDRSLLKGCELYVNLEPCSHHGKTPPCADRLIAEGIRVVHIASSDPNPLVAGRGIKKLKEAGVKVESGILEKEAIELNRRFYCYHSHKRPYVILKWAQTSDGFIGKEEGRLLISNQFTNTLVHQWRSEEQAILAGKNTVLKDDPLLDVRHVKGKDPVRIIIDAALELPDTLRLFNDGKNTLVLNLKEEGAKGQRHYKKLKAISAKDVLDAMYNMGINSVLVEGGKRTHEMFIHEGLWDEARIITSPQVAEQGIKAAVIEGVHYSDFILDGDEIRIIRNSSGPSFHSA